jgi:hypothetical protein
MDSLYCLILEHLLIQEWYNVIGPEGSQYTLVQPLKKSTVPTLYHFIDENIGIVKHLAPKETWLKGSKATKFDALAFITFYASVGYSVLLSEWGLKESDVLWSRYSQKKTRNVTSFTMSRSMDSGEMDECRKHKLDELRHQISKLFKTLQQAKRTVEYTGKPGVFYSFWKNVNTFGSLPFEQRDLFDQLIRVAAYLLLNVLVFVID